MSSRTYLRYKLWLGLSCLLPIAFLMHCATGVDPVRPGSGGASGSGSLSGPSGPASSSQVGSSSSSASSGSSSSSSVASSGSGGDGGLGCLQNIPPNCPNCQTMNASDKPKCMEYLMCFLNNNCIPTDPCSTNPDGVCGVNTLGGGNAPKDAAIQTYMCACP